MQKNMNSHSSLTDTKFMKKFICNNYPHEPVFYKNFKIIEHKTPTPAMIDSPISNLIANNWVNTPV